MLKISKSFLTTLIEAIPSAIYLKDSNGKYLMINKKGAASVGKCPKDFIGKDDTEIFPKKVATRVMKLDQEVFDGYVQNGEEKADGDQCFISQKFIIDDKKSKTRILAGISTDITEIKRTEKKLLEAQKKAETDSQHKSIFLQNMSHELRTPLNAIIGFSSILSGESGIKAQKFEENFTEYAKLIHLSGIHLLSIVNDLLDLSKIEAGEQEFNEVEIDVKYEIFSCLHTFKNLAAENNIELKDDIADENFFLLGDEKILKQLLYNLVSNAIKYSPAGNIVTVKLAIRDNNAIEILIIDSGIGMTKEELDIAMIPFRRVAEIKNSDIPGTGLGLPLVDAYIRLYQGQLDIQSEKGVGTTASLLFPAKRTVKD